MGQMADFPPLVASSVFDFKKHEVPQIKSETMRDTLMNLVNRTLFKNVHINNLAYYQLKHKILGGI